MHTNTHTTVLITFNSNLEN